jgi:threonine/homoserine/homoserine lactone efflux protein
METFFSLLLFVFVASITPGPNNLMLLSAGANFGFRKSLPHVFGINVGSGLMVLIVGVGLTELFHQYPVVFLVLKFASLTYLMYLAWRLIQSKKTNTENKHALKPLTFWEAAAFQWINPKAWAMVLTAVSVYVLGDSYALVSLTALTFSAMNLPCIFLWLTTGVKLQTWLAKGQRQYGFNCVMATLLLASAVPIMFM